MGGGVRLPLRRAVGARARLRPAWPRRTSIRTDEAAVERADDAHGHGQGGHAGMSMEAMVRDMRNRFLVALLFTMPDRCLVDGRDEAARHGAGHAVRPRPRHLAVAAEPPGRPLRVLDLLHRRVGGAARKDARHDGPGRRGDRRRLDLLGRRDFLHHGRRLLRGRGDARDVRAARPLVRDARAGRRERRDPRVCSTWRRPRRWCCAMASRSRSPRPRSRSATCC